MKPKLKTALYSLNICRKLSIKLPTFAIGRIRSGFNNKEKVI